MTRRDESDERALAEAIMASSEDGISAVDLDGRLIMWNEAAARLYGIPASATLGHHVTEFVPADEADDLLERMRRARAGETQRYDRVWTKPDGERVAVAVTMSALGDATGRPLGITSISRDVTAVREAEAEWQRGAVRAALLARATRQLAATLDIDRTAAAVVRLLVPEFADLCTLRLVSLDGAALELVAMHHADPVKLLLAERYEEKSRAAESGSPHWEVIRRGETLWVPEVTEMHFTTLDSDPERREIGRAFAPRSLLMVPLRAAGTVIGTMAAVITEPGRSFTIEDRDFATEVGDRAAQALLNARLYTAERRARHLAQDRDLALHAAEARFRAAFDHAPVGMAVLELRGPKAFTLAEVNGALCELSGHPRHLLVGTDFRTMVHRDDRREVDQSLDRLVNGQVTSYSVERRFVDAEGDVLWIQLRAALLSGEPGEGPTQAVVQVQDITERRRYESRLQHLADHDALTGLFNRRRFNEELDRTLANVERYGDCAALIAIDLDNFKYVNDTYGHAVGDQVLIALAGTLRGRARESDVLARLGGDEFGLILPKVTEADAEAVAAELLELIRTGLAVRAGDRLVRPTASAGVRMVVPGSGTGVEELLVEADIAMYDAKESGRDRLSIVGEGSARSARVRSELTWSDRIRDALEADDDAGGVGSFCLYEQPILSLASGMVERAEVLIRMVGADGALIPPGTFLPVAERFGHIGALDRWVVRAAVRLLAERQAAGHRIGIEINLSGASITDPEVIEFIVAEVSGAQVDPTLVTFEVTETAAIVNVERARQLARRLADLGCHFALDDFGSGFGSFYYLKHLPFDLVKIDGDFIKDLPRSVPDQLTVQAIVQIARGLGKPTIAEFVGDQETIELLTTYGVDHAQGYHVGKPRPAVAQPSFEGWGVAA